MKALLTIAMVAIFGAMVSANPGSKTDYLVTKDGKVIVADVHFGFFRIHAKSTDNLVTKINYNDVVSYHKDGETYVKKPLYNDNKCSGCEVFMRLVSWRNGLGLYCYEDPSLDSKSNKRYFIFKDEETLWLEVSPRNAETIRIFFSK